MNPMKSKETTNNSRGGLRSNANKKENRPTATATATAATTSAEEVFDMTPIAIEIEGLKLDVGDQYVVQRNNDWYSIKIIQRRRLKIPGPGGDKYEYYIHYVGCDRRLDEWVPRNRIRNLMQCGGGESTPGTSKASAVYSAVVTVNSPLVSTGFENRKITRNQKRKHDEENHVQRTIEEMDPVEAAQEMEHQAATKIKYIEKIQFGEHEIGAWYFSPFPEKFGKSKVLLVCEFCLKYTASLRTYKHHVETCRWHMPPGREIYRKGTLAIFEVDGIKDKEYCQNLCLLSKLFLDHKTLHFGVEDFFFYMLCEWNDSGAHVVGYFSKEKASEIGNNVACILTLPPHQNKGYGKILIEFSYELSKIEGVLGSPEKPLSDLGKRSYRSFWTWKLLETLRDKCGKVTIKDLSAMTSITEADITSTLLTLNMTKYWKGKNVIVATNKIVEDYIIENAAKRPKIFVDPKCIRWTPSIKEKPKKK